MRSLINETKQKAAGGGLPDYFTLLPRVGNLHVPTHGSTDFFDNQKSTFDFLHHDLAVSAYTVIALFDFTTCTTTVQERGVACHYCLGFMGHVLFSFFVSCPTLVGQR